MRTPILAWLFTMGLAGALNGSVQAKTTAANPPKDKYPVYQQAESCPPATTSITKLALEFAQKGELDKADEAFSQAFDQCPKNATVLANRGAVRLSQGRVTEALHDIERARELALNPKATDSLCAAAYVARGRSRYQSRDFRQALSDFGKASHLDPHNARIYEGVARIEWEYHEYDECVRYSDRALQEEAADAGVLLLRANCRAANGDTKEAEAAWTALLAVTPEDSRAWVGRALARAEQGQCAGAAKDMIRANRLHAVLTAPEQEKLIDRCPKQFAPAPAKSRGGK